MVLKKSKSPSRYIRALHIDESCMDLPYTREILERCGDLPVKLVADRQMPEVSTAVYPQSLQTGKQHLFLTRNRGRFLKPCPGTREYRCCGYQVLNIGMNCTMDCVYCILQAYLNNPWLSFFVNYEELLAELDVELASSPMAFHRIGTGEFTDSLVLDRLTALSKILVEYMADKTSAVLELKTKTAEVANLQGLKHNGRTIVSWSLNSGSVMRCEELRTASLAERLAAAAKCADWGYRLGFHFDPVIYQPDWEEGYAQTIARLFDAVPAERIAWISIGALRYLPTLKSVALQRFPKTGFWHEEFVMGLDGKQRYFREMRVEMYKRIVDAIMARVASSTCVYLCMESDEIWQAVFGYTPEARGGLSAMLDRAAGCGNG